MKKLAFLSVLVLALSIQAFSQTAIVIQNGSKVYMSHRMDSIKVNVADGDTVYLPGGPINMYGDWVIDEELHIFGVGFFPDSTTATQPTKFTANQIIFIKGADNSTIEGIHFDGSIRFGDYYQSDSVSHITIKRCWVQQLYLGYNSPYSFREVSNINITECVVNGSVMGEFATFINFEKCIFNGQVMNLNGNVLFANNIFTYNSTSYSSSAYCLRDITNCLLKNNIFLHGHKVTGATYCTFNNNMFCHPQTEVTNTYNAQNITVADYDSVLFVSYVQYYDYTNDMHLQATSPAVNAGDDGTDLGIYGTSVPTKDGWIPMVPHIQMVNIAPNSTNGKVPVQVKTQAQSSF